MDLVIIEGPYVSLLGINWFESLGIEIMGINQASAATLDFNKVCKEFPAAFDGILGLYNRCRGGVVMTARSEGFKRGLDKFMGGTDTSITIDHPG